METEKYGEDDDDEDETGREIHDEIAVQVVDEEWTRTFQWRILSLKISSVKIRQSSTFLNFFSQNFK